MPVTYDCFCVDGISERETLSQHNVAVTHNTDGGSALVHFPCSTYLHRWLYSALVCVCVFLCNLLSASGETHCCCSGVVWSVIIFSVWVSLYPCLSLSLLPNGSRYVGDKPISGSWQNVRLSRIRGAEMWFVMCVFFVQNGHIFLSLTEHQHSINAVWESGLRLQSWPLRLNMFNL